MKPKKPTTDTTPAVPPALRSDRALIAELAMRQHGISSGSLAPDLCVRAAVQMIRAVDRYLDEHGK